MFDQYSNTTITWTGLSDSKNYTYQVNVTNIVNNWNSTLVRHITLDTTPPNITIVYPRNNTMHNISSINFNVSVLDNVIGTDSCLYSLDSDINITMTKFNATYFNYTYNISHGFHNITFSCNDSLNNWNFAFMNNFSVNLMDLSISNVTLPIKFYSNMTLIVINVSNNGPPNATNINVSCYLNNLIFDSKLIPNITGRNSSIINCTRNFTSGDNQNVSIIIDPSNFISENNKSNNYYNFTVNITQLGALESYDLENDSEDKSGWFMSEQETLPLDMTYFFTNYTMSSSSAEIIGANCTIDFSGGTQLGTGTKFNMSYNNSAGLYYYNRTFSYSGNYSWEVNCSKDKYENKSFTSDIKIRIPLYNPTSIGSVNGKNNVNYNENVNLSVNIPSSNIDNSSIGYNISKVWVSIRLPNLSFQNISLSGNVTGGIWNATYINTGLLGDYNLVYYANLTNGFSTVLYSINNFSVQNISISIISPAVVNTTDKINVKGLIRRTNGTSYWNLSNNPILIKINNILVSTDFVNGTNSFSLGNYSNLTFNDNKNMTLNLSIISNVTAFRDFFNTDPALGVNVVDSNSNGYNFDNQVIFDQDYMISPTGNITYKFTTPTKLYGNATILMGVGASVGSGGNTSIWYSYNYVNWTLLNATNRNIQNKVFNRTISVQGNSTFYVRMVSDTSQGATPVNLFTVNFTSYLYKDNGIFVSSSMKLPNVTYTNLEILSINNNGSINVQLRESDNNLTWSEWSSMLNNSVNDISNFSQQYLQYRVLFSTPNTNLTPVLQNIFIDYSNTTTNSTGGYDYNITVPATDLGPRTLEVSVVHSDSGIIGKNSTNIVLWARTNLSYSTNVNYSAKTNYSVSVNFTRSDTGAAINGTINLVLFNSSYSSSKICSGSNCINSWKIPGDLGFGNYTVNITGSNETAYFYNSSISFSADNLEETTTTANFFSENKSISNYMYSREYSYLWNVTINNTGFGSIIDPKIVPALPYEGRIKNITEFVNSCSRIYPGQLCNVLINVTLIQGASSGEILQTLKLNWTNNNGTSSPTQTYTMSIFIESNSFIDLSPSLVNLTMQHNSNSSFNFTVGQGGSEDLQNVRLDFSSYNVSSQYTIPQSWINLSNYLFPVLYRGESRGIEVNVSVPIFSDPGNYSGVINVTSDNGGANFVYLTIVVPVNGSWYFVPSNNMSCNDYSCKNYSFNGSSGFDFPGEIASYTIFNIGNINLTLNVTYAPTTGPGQTDYSNLRNSSSAPLFDLTNPGDINVEKGKNSTLSIRHTGSNIPLVNVGVITNFYNESATPISASVMDAFNVASQPPSINDILFSYDNFATTTNIAEVYRNLTIKVVAESNEQLNLTTTVINITPPFGAVISLQAVQIPSETVYSNGKPKKVNYTATYVPQYNGFLYLVRAMVFSAPLSDVGTVKYNLSKNYNITTVGATVLRITENYSQINISNVDLNNKGIFYINYTINNSGGLVSAYNPIITFSGSSVIESPLIRLANISANSTVNSVVQFNISKLTPPGTYNLAAIVRWINPVSILTPSYVSSTPVNFNITVFENKSIVQSPESLSYSFSSGNVEQNSIRINNTGNAPLTKINLSCYNDFDGNLCNNFRLSLSNNNFDMPVNTSKEVNITLSYSAGLATGTYTGHINISEQNVSKNFYVYANVPSSYTWSVSTVSINSTKGTGQRGNLQEIIINNTGNNILTLDINTTNSSIVYANVSQIVVPVFSTVRFMLNYSAPMEEGSYPVIIGIAAASGSMADPLQRDILVNLTSTNMIINILSPTSLAKETGVLSGQFLEDKIKVNAAYSGVPIIDNSNWSVKIGNSDCTNLSYRYDDTGPFWIISCNAPNLPDGLTYDLTVIIDNLQHGITSTTEPGLIVYKDITPPKIYPIQNNINKNESINLQVNVTDNVNVTNVTAYITYPNLTVINVSLSLFNGYYINNSFVLDVGGEYLVNYTAVDASRNQNSSSDWFEVYDKYPWVIKLVDYNFNNISNVNISLYRPESIFLLNNITDITGEATLLVNTRFYDLHSTIEQDSFVLQNVNLTNITDSNISLNFHEVNGEDLEEIVPLYKVFRGIASNSTGFEKNNISVTFNYSGLSYESSVKLSIVRCNLWNYTYRKCSGGWSAISSLRDLNSKKITGNSSDLGTYFIAESKCGNGLCEVAYLETTSSCPDDCKEAGSVTVISGGSSGGGGGGGGGGSSSGLSNADLTKIENIVKSFLDIGGIKLETTSIYKEMFAGETTTIRIRLKNAISDTKEIYFTGSGDTKQFLFFESTNIILAPKEERDVLVKIVAPKTVDAGTYEGDLVLTSGEDQGKIPVTIRILAPEGKLLDVKIQPLVSSVAPGKVLRLQTDLLNLGKSKKVDVQFDLQLMDINTGEILARNEEAFAVETTISTIKNMTIPENIAPGKYMIKGTAYYSNPEQTNMQASSITYITVEYPLMQRKVLGIPVWGYIIFLFVIAIILGLLSYVRWLQYKKKRFRVSVDLTKLPEPGANSAFVGKVAETGIRTFVDMNKLQMHTLIAGSTGSGKTVAAQGIIEEALLHNKSVIVFDPTAQWTGFLRKTDDKSMVRRYQYFDMKEKEARGFNGTIKTISDPYELINIKKYLNRPGEITIFNVSRLTPKEIDVVVASTIEQIFKSEPEEARELKTLIVYDEVHRLLPKFGGSGQGFVQLERGAREFRKWGIGLFLISQVLSDFIGEIKANIGTEVQMGTRYEGDLERVNMKYGEDVLKSVVKEPIGTGMVTNAEYNNGRPYFVAFRPLLHSTKRLSNDELAKYEKYFEEVEDLEYQMQKLEEYGVDVLDLKLEIKLAKNKVKEGQFQMADMYLETLRPGIEEQWKKSGKKVEHVVKEKISKEEVVKGIEKAKQEREKFLKSNPQEALSIDSELKKLKDLLDTKKKSGKNTIISENNFNNLQTRLKPLNGKPLSASDVDSLKLEIKNLTDEINKI
ncbi:Uncharacterised protein [uncultured archaeon]|nr:Uncharacterised protein [uncultured archaeon]